MIRRAGLYGLLALSLATPALAAEAIPAQSHVPAPATVDVTVRGIDDGIRALQSMRGNQQAQQTALVLMLLKGVGRPGPAEGRGRLDYRIDVRADGRVYVNDMDITVLIETANRTQRR